jgi:signal transduction histidine kinase
MSLKNVMRSRSTWAFVLSCALSVTTYYIFEGSQNIRRQSILADGLNTCFNRLGQTHTSSLIKSKESIYLQADFLNLTQECFEEAHVNADENFTNILPQMVKKFSSLSADVHWYQGKIESKSSDLESLEQRFDRLESLKNEVQEEGDDFREKVSDRLAFLKFLFYLFAALVPMIIAWDYLKNRKLAAQNEQIEKSAQSIISTGVMADTSRIEEVIKTALEQNRLSACSELFSIYQVDQMEADTDNNRHNPFIAPVYEEKTVEEVIELKNKLNVTTFDYILAKVVDNLSGKIFTQGVILDLDVDEEVVVEGGEENLEQILFQALSHSLESCTQVVGSKKMSISMKKLGGTVLVEVKDSGLGFSPELISDLKWKKTSFSSAPVNLQIAQDLAQMIKGEVSIDNICNENGQIIGASTKIQLRLAPKKLVEKSTVRKLVELKKGKKRELIKNLARF